MRIQKYGKKKGRQQYKCLTCQHQFVIHYNQQNQLKQSYQTYAIGKQTLKELSQQTGKSIRTLQRQFDQLPLEIVKTISPIKSINLIADATFFSRSDGVLVFRANQVNLHWRFITSETLAEISAGLNELDQQGYHFKSVTLDGRRGVIKLFEQRYPALPIQLCQFHQAQIIRRYTTNNPKTDCGRALKILMQCLTAVDYFIFQTRLEALHEEHLTFLKERNEQGQFKHRQLRSAFRSLKTNLPYLFVYKQFPELGIPNTTNSCDGSFAHWKQKVKIHRGLRKHRRNKMISFLLNQL
jgi:hypothetical protein